VIRIGAVFFALHELEFFGNIFLYPVGSVSILSLAAGEDMDEASWKRLLHQIREGYVVPIIGCRLLVDDDGKSTLQAKVASQILADNGLNPEDEPLPPFRELNEAVTRLRQKGTIKLQDIYTDVDHAIRDLTGAKDFVVPTPIRQLAEISAFRLLVTLTPDDLLARSLRSRCLVNEIVHAPKWSGPSEEKDLPPDWSERRDEVQLLYLLGKSRPTAVYAIHDEDVLEYAHDVIAKGGPKVFIGELQQRNLLLIGCNFPDWLSRFFLRATRQDRLVRQSEKRREWLIEPLMPEESLTCFLRSFSKDTEILADSAPMDFVAELHRRWTAEDRAEQPQLTTSTGRPTPSQPMFFISYSRRTDLTRAESLYRALRKIGVQESEVWFDGRDIEPGHDLHIRIREVIRNCRYFLALLSYDGDCREEAFVFNEWQEANVRNRQLNREFIFPVIVEAEYEPLRYKARPVLEGDWARLRFCHAPAGVPDDSMTTKLKQLLREARRP
jgi:TIR domain-containing protein